MIPPEVEVRPLFERQEAALLIVNEIAPETFPTDQWEQRKFIFRLIRRFMGMGGNVEDYQPAFVVLCNRIARESVTQAELW